MSDKKGCIQHLFMKMQKGSAMVELNNLSLKVGHGIEGDINAHAMSPRQILIVNYQDILELLINPGDLRENILLTGLESENFVPGSLITFESGAAIRLTFYCEPCKRIAHLVKSLKSIQGKRGILGVAIASGKIKVGTNYQIQANQFPALPENPYKRFLNYIEKVPQGKIVTYKQILQGIGVDHSYMRAIPTYLKKTAAEIYPLHRILDSQGNLISYVDEQQSKLESEGIKILSKTDLLSNLNKYFVSVNEYLWQDETIYLK